MTFLPIVERELRVAARLTATYRNRVLLAGIVSVAAMMMLVFGMFSALPSETGMMTFWTLAYFALAFCLLEGMRKTADCLSEEKRDGTIGLLFLTDLKGYDIVLGKLAAESLNSVYGLISVLPVLALPLLLGGVTQDEFWRVSLALVNTLFLSLSAGMFISAVSRRERRARAGTLLLLAVLLAAPFLTFKKALFAFSPVYSFPAAEAKMYFRSPQIFWRSMETTQALGWALLLLAAILIPRCWQDEKMFSPSRWRRQKTRATATSFPERAAMLEVNPAFWLAARHSGHRPLIAVAIAVAIGGSITFIYMADEDALPVFLAACWIVNLLLKVRVGLQSCHYLAEARRNNALEMLLATPLNVERIIQGQLLALKRIFLAPITIIISLEVVGLLAGQYSASREAARHGNTTQESYVTIIEIGLVAGYLALFVLDIFAVTWGGMWFGLSSKNESQAVTKTIGIGLLLPLFLSIFFCYGFPFVVGIPIFLIVWGGQNLRRQFRQLAAQQYPAKPRGSGWWPGS